MAKSKKIAIVVAAIALIAVIGVVGSTLAYFTDKDTKTNTFAMGNVNGVLKEDTDSKKGEVVDGGIDFGKDKPVMPGDNLDKEPYIELGGDSSDAFVRVKLTWLNADDTALSAEDAAKINDSLLDIQGTWIKGENDYYYYQKKLSKTNVTDKLFTRVAIPDDWNNSMVNKKFKLKIDAELIQAENTGITEGGIINSWPVTSEQIEQYKAQ